MKLLITGAAGQLGQDLVEQAKQRGFEVIGTTSKTMDISNPDQIQQVMEQEQPQAIIHGAAWTKVDAAEDPELYDQVKRINADGTGYLASYCKEKNIPFLYVSTDYVFDGQKASPWKEDDEKNPLNVYGLTKSMGEEFALQVPKHFIVRVSWVFGLHGNNFVKTMLRLGQAGSPLKVVEDQVGAPTYTYDLARLLLDMIQSNKYGIYHATNGGSCSWYEFAKEIFEQAGLKPELSGCTSDEFKTAAKRPMNSIMSQQKIIENGFTPLPHWKDALGRFLKQLEQE